MAKDGPGPSAHEAALRLVRDLADGIGPRPPTSDAERQAFALLARRLQEAGVESAELREIDAYRSFGYPFGILLSLAVLPSLLPARARRLRMTLAAIAGLGLASESSLRLTPLSSLLARRRSANLIAELHPQERPRRTLCLTAHVDTSRSGLLFNARFARALPAWIAAQAVSVLTAVVAEPPLGRRRRGRALLTALRAVPALGLGLLLERELRGTDVPGANDNASGVAVAVGAFTERVVRPLQDTRLVLVLTGAEEAGTLGMRTFLRERDTDGWLFLNIDNVGGPGTLRYLQREGVLTRWPADPGLLGVADAVTDSQPELRMAATDRPAGLTFDSSPVLAAGGRALTLSVQDGVIPNLHLPTDTVENVDAGGIARTLAATRAIIDAVDRGEADR